jgi:hypothetical protein
MPKNTISWLPLQEAMSGTITVPEVTFKEPVQKEVARILGVIDYADTRANGTPSRLVSFASNSDPGDFYVRDAAIIKVFSGLGLLAAYFNEPSSIKSTYRETDRGWESAFRNTRNQSGLFKVVYSRDKDTQVDRQTVSYVAKAD